MGLPGKSLDEKAQEAIAQVGRIGLGVKTLNASVSGRMVTLTGEAPKDAAANVPLAPAAEFEWYEVKKGDTLSAPAKCFYGKGSLYMKIFDANKDVLTNPDLIKVGPKLRIPK